MHKKILNKSLNISAWLQVVFGALVFFIVSYGIYTLFLKQKKINPKNVGWK
jgi:hypothetical protein